MYATFKVVAVGKPSTSQKPPQNESILTLKFDRKAVAVLAP